MGTFVLMVASFVLGIALAIGVCVWLLGRPEFWWPRR